MDFALVEQQLNDLPATFKRDGAPYTQVVDSLAALLDRYTNASDGSINQVADFSGAQFGWLDIWGLLFGLPRQANEADQLYGPRIQYEVMAGNGTPVGMAYWIRAVWRVSATIVEALPALGYSITFPASVTDTQIAEILASLSRVRPAGVPITSVSRLGTGLYVTTINFLGASRVTGAYITGGTTGLGFILYPATNNAEPILPDILLTDPVLNS